jgi:hypothetical protein
VRLIAESSASVALALVGAVPQPLPRREQRSPTTQRLEVIGRVRERREHRPDERGVLARAQRGGAREHLVRAQRMPEVRGHAADDAGEPRAERGRLARERVQQQQAAERDDRRAEGVARRPRGEDLLVAPERGREPGEALCQQISNEYWMRGSSSSSPRMPPAPGRLATSTVSPRPSAFRTRPSHCSSGTERLRTTLSSWSAVKAGGATLPETEEQFHRWGVQSRSSHGLLCVLSSATGVRSAHGRRLTHHRRFWHTVHTRLAGLEQTSHNVV